MFVHPRILFWKNLEEAYFCDEYFRKSGVSSMQRMEFVFFLFNYEIRD